MRTLTLALNGEYFDAIKAGTKLEEYRLVTPYWRKRLGDRSYDRIELTRGYPAREDRSRRLTLPWRGCRVTTITHAHFGNDPVEVFAIAVAELSRPEADWALAPEDATHVMRRPGSARVSWIKIVSKREVFWRWPSNQNWFVATDSLSDLLESPYIEERPA